MARSCWIAKLRRLYALTHVAIRKDRHPLGTEDISTNQSQILYERD